MQSSILYNAKLWQSHAERVRLLCRSVADPRTRQHMLSVAAGFDRIAGLAVELKPAAARAQHEYRSPSRFWSPAVPDENAFRR